VRIADYIIAVVLMAQIPLSAPLTVVLSRLLIPTARQKSALPATRLDSISLERPTSFIFTVHKALNAGVFLVMVYEFR